MADILGLKAPGSGAATTARSMMPPPPPPRTPLTTPPHSAPVGQTYERKRKLSLSAPFLDNVKRIMTPTSAKKPNITHTTHEATAGNRVVGGVGAGSGRSTPIGAMAGTDHRTKDKDTSTKTSEHRDVATPTFARPATPRTNPEPEPDPPTSTTTTKPSMNIFHSLTSRRHRRRETTDTTGSASTSTSLNPDTTSKSALNRLIITLRGEINDLTLQNRVLQDQVGIVRKDWIETSQELDLERMRAWQCEMEVFRMGVRIEELRAEVGSLKRGSLVE